MNKKIIGISSKLIEIPNMPIHNGDIVSYFKAVERAGAVPIMIPMLEELDHLETILDILDGVILTGGSDVHPILYKEDPINELSNVQLRRDKFEMKILELALGRNLPIIGICRGMQLANVYWKGSLYQDIFSQLENVLGHLHTTTVADGHHNIELNRDGFLYDIFDEEVIMVNSIHHQAIKDLADGLNILAKSKDGIIEAVEHVNHQFIGLQFHPEEMIETDKRFLEIFKYGLKINI